MDLKVVLVGYGPVNRSVATMLRDRDVEVLFVEEEPSRARQASEEGHECAVGLVLDRDVQDAVGDADAFVLMDLDPLRVDKLARSLRRRHPHARVISPDVQLLELRHLGGPDDGRPPGDAQSAAASQGNGVRLGLQAVAQAVVSTVEDHMARRSAERLEEVLRAGPPDGEVAVFTHDDPDPDAMASGMAVLRICDAFGLGAKLYHGGALLRLENRFFARLLEVPLSSVTREEAAAVVGHAGRVVLVDAGRPGEHNALPRGSVPNVVLDHHSTNREVLTGDYCDVRPHVGSASTLLTLYLQGLGITPGRNLATALLYGLRTDTDHLRRNTFPADARVSVYLSGLADQGILDLLERPPRSAEVMDTIGRALLGRLRAGDHVFTWVGELASRDDLSQVADFLMLEDDVAAVFVFGRVGDTVHLSARAVEGGPHVGEIANRALEGVGSGGGHPTMGGGSLTPSMAPGTDMGQFVQSDLYEAFAEAAGVGAALDTARTGARATRGGG